MYRQSSSGDADTLRATPPGGAPLRAPRAHKGADSHEGISPRSPKRPNQATEMGSNVYWRYGIIFNSTGDPDAGGEGHIATNIRKRAVFAPQGDHVTLGWVTL